MLERVFPDPNENPVEPSTEQDLNTYIAYDRDTGMPVTVDDKWMDYGPRKNY